MLNKHWLTTSGWLSKQPHVVHSVCINWICHLVNQYSASADSGYNICNCVNNKQSDSTDAFIIFILRLTITLIHLNS